MLYGVDKDSSKAYPLFISAVLPKDQQRVGRYRVRKVVWPVGSKNKVIELNSEFFIKDKK